MFWNPRAAHSGRGRRASARAAGCGGDRHAAGGPATVRGDAGGRGL